MECHAVDKEKEAYPNMLIGTMIYWDVVKTRCREGSKCCCSGCSPIPTNPVSHLHIYGVMC